MKDLEKKVEQYANHIMSSLAGAHGSFKDTRADEDIVAGILKHFAATVRQEAYEDAAKIRLSNKEAAEFLGISPLTLNPKVLDDLKGAIREAKSHQKSTATRAIRLQSNRSEHLGMHDNAKTQTESTAEAAQPMSERKQFEAWMKEEYEWVSLARDPIEGLYLDHVVTKMWEAWQAARAGMGEQQRNILCGACQILDVVKIEWGTAWSEWDQSIRDGLSKMQATSLRPETGVKE